VVSRHAPGRDALLARRLPRPGVRYLGVVPTLALLRLHEEVHAALRDAMVAPRDGSAGGAWVPRCTLAHDLPAPSSHGASTCCTTRCPSPPMSAARACSTPPRVRCSRSPRSAPIRRQPLHFRQRAADWRVGAGSWYSRSRSANSLMAGTMGQS
jgi:hypothetical protein